MAWVITLKPTVRHPRERFQVRYRDHQGIERSGGIYPTPRQAETEKKRIARGKPPTKPPRQRRPRTSGEPTGPTPTRADIVTLGDYVTKRWWEAWKVLHPATAPYMHYTLNNRILPAFGRIALADLDADLITAWKADLITAGLKPHTINGYLSRFSQILNAAVDAGYLDRNPMLRRSGSGRVPQLKNLETEPVGVWLTQSQLDQLAAAIGERYAALVVLGGRAGLRFGEAVALRWTDIDLDVDYDDGAVAGRGRLRITAAVSDPTRSGRSQRGRVKTRAGRRTIALDHETVEIIKRHKKRYGDDPQGRVITSPGGSRGPSGTPASHHFSEVWRRALRTSGLAAEFPTMRRLIRVNCDGRMVPQQIETSVLTFHGLRHSHATHLIALGRPLNAVAARLGHGSVAFTMDIYAAVISRHQAGSLTPHKLGLNANDNP